MPLLEDRQPRGVIPQADVADQLEAGGQLHGVHRLLSLVDQPREVPGPGAEMMGVKTGCEGGACGNWTRSAGGGLRSELNDETVPSRKGLMRMFWSSVVQSRMGN